MTDMSTSSRNESYKIQDLVNMVESGRIRIPEFQRSFRWRPSDVLALFDSLLRGYPFGSMLLWKKEAPAGRLVIGAIEIDADERSESLWVIDGQQRITSLVNAVNPKVVDDERFAISFVLEKNQFRLTKDVKDDLSIPLPDIFDLRRAFSWLQRNPDAEVYAEDIQRVTGLLRDVEVPAAVIDEGNEQLLREIFDRINSAGKRLRGSEIFDAIHGGSNGIGDEHSMSTIGDRLDSRTEFGRMPDQVIYQAILVIRHPDLSRNVRAEFSGEREAAVSFASDNQVEAYQRGEDALYHVAKFLQNNAGIPHITFVPFRFHLLVLARFFAHFPNPSPRNLELLSRWVWRSTALAGQLGYTGSTANIRTLANLVDIKSESESVQKLIEVTSSFEHIPSPDLLSFRTNKASGKIVLGALWDLGPIDPKTSNRLELTDIAGALEGETSLKNVALELLPKVPASDGANRFISTAERTEFVENLVPWEAESHLVSEDMMNMLDLNHTAEFLKARRIALGDQVAKFLSVKAGTGFATNRPLVEFNLDSPEDV